MLGAIGVGTGGAAAKTIAVTPTVPPVHPVPSATSSPSSPPAPSAHRSGSTDGVRCGDVIAVDTTLIRDLRCPGDGLIIGASDVTLDLAGHTISGAGAGAGVWSNSSFVLTIENGTIRNFTSGIVLFDAGSRGTATIANMTISANTGTGIDLGGDSWLDVVTGNTVSGNGGDGIRARYANDATTYENNRVFSNGGAGFAVDQASSSFIGNDVRRNGDDGITVSDVGAFFAPAYHFLDNTADRNGQLGIRVTIFDDFSPPQNVDDQGGNEAKLNGDLAECMALGTGPIPPVPLGLTCAVAADTSQLSYTGATVFALGTSPTMTAMLVDTADLGNPLVGEDVVFELDGQSCTGTTDTDGRVSCPISGLAEPLGPQPLLASFAGDTDHLGSADTREATIFAFPARGAFTLGDLTVAAATPATTVTWWGHDWWRLNDLSGGTAPASHKGFARETSTVPPRCGGSWTRRPGAGSDPPTSVPSYMGVLVSSKIVGGSSGIAGNIGHIAVVKTNPGYQADPEHPGTGTIVATIC